MNSRTTRSLLIAVFLTWLPAGIAAAQPTDGAADDAAEARALLEEGMALQRANQTDLAMEAYRDALALDPMLVGAYWELGWSHYVRHELVETIRLWEKTLALDPTHPEAPAELEKVREERRLRDAAAALATAGGVTLPAEAGEVGDARLMLAAVGDIMMGDGAGGPGRVPPDDGRALFPEVTPILRAADIAFGNLEGVMADSGTSSKCRPDSEKCYAFRMPTALGPRLVEAGFDAADCLVTVPLVPQRIEDYFDAWKGRIVCWGGLPSILFDPAFPMEEYRRYVDHLVKVTEGRNDFIFGASDQVMPGAEWERLLHLAEMTGNLKGRT